MSEANTTLRKEVSELLYQQAKEQGKSTPLELTKSIRQWEHWRLIDNDYPYDICFATHHMMVPKRAGVAERFDLNDDEKKEFDQILKDFVYENYDLWFENCPRKRTMSHIYHVHLATYYPSRAQMAL